MVREPEVVWLFEERTFGFLIYRGAYYSLIKYAWKGIDYEVEVANDDYEFWQEHAIEYEQD